MAIDYNYFSYACCCLPLGNVISSVPKFSALLVKRCGEGLGLMLRRDALHITENDDPHITYLFHMVLVSPLPDAVGASILDIAPTSLSGA